MWGRIIESMIGLWLMISPFVFGHYPDNRPLWSNDLLCGAAVFLLAFVSFWSLSWWRFLQYAHLGILAVAGWLLGFGYIHGGYPALPGAQNDILVGLTLLLLAVIPNHADLPPPSWRRYAEQHIGSQKP
jgi:hypothetical protein